MIEWWLQADLESTKEEFLARFGDQPRKDDLMILVPKYDDPQEQVCLRVTQFLGPA